MRAATAGAVLTLLASLTSCTAGRAGGTSITVDTTVVVPASTVPSDYPSSTAPVSTASATRSRQPIAGRSREPGSFTFAFAGDVHFAGRRLTRLNDNPATAFGVAAAALSRADLTMVNLETAITDAGDKQNKSFTFRAPSLALTALRAAGIDLATEANNHGADYGASGLRDTLSAIRTSKFPVIGIGANAAQAYAPFTRTVNGVRVAVLAASQVADETLLNWTATPESAGIANANSPRLISAVRAAKAGGSLVVVYVHWGTEYTTCPNSDQRRLADSLVAAGATAVIGTHAHMLQGAGWRKDGAYVAYGLSNYLWWRSFGNEQDDAGVLSLTFSHGKVADSSFSAAHLDETGVPVPATGATARRITSEWERDRECAGLASSPPH